MFESSPVLKKGCTPWGTREAVADANYALQSSKIFDGGYARSASEFAADELQGIYRADEQDVSRMDGSQHLAFVRHPRPVFQHGFMFSMVSILVGLLSLVDCFSLSPCFSCFLPLGYGEISIIGHHRIGP